MLFIPSVEFLGFSFHLSLNEMIFHHLASQKFKAFVCDLSTINTFLLTVIDVLVGTLI